MHSCCNVFTFELTKRHLGLCTIPTIGFKISAVSYANKAILAIVLKSIYMEHSITVKAKVYVTLKSGVLDPQGKAIQHSVELLGFDGIQDIRQGKYFEVAIDQSLDQTKAQNVVERLAREVLSNPVIEDFRVEIER
jgi:phosphoribosylformylglycinamidine synthase subunit PurS